MLLFPVFISILPQLHLFWRLIPKTVATLKKSKSLCKAVILLNSLLILCELILLCAAIIHTPSYPIAEAFDQGNWIIDLFYLLLVITLHIVSTLVILNRRKNYTMYLCPIVVIFGIFNFIGFNVGSLGSTDIVQMKRVSNDLSLILTKRDSGIYTVNVLSHYEIRKKSLFENFMIDPIFISVHSKKMGWTDTCDLYTSDHGLKFGECRLLTFDRIRSDYVRRTQPYDLSFFNTDSLFLDYVFSITDKNKYYSLFKAEIERMNITGQDTAHIAINDELKSVSFEIINILNNFDTVSIVKFSDGFRRYRLSLSYVD